MLPRDPMMLLSVVNLKLRDQYKSLDDMCEDLDIPMSEITEPLKEIGYTYQKENNQFG